MPYGKNYPKVSIDNSKRPTHYKNFPIDVSLWENKSKNNVFYTFNIQRVYKDKNNKWKNTSTFRISDIPKITVILCYLYNHYTLQLPEKG